MENRDFDSNKFLKFWSDSSDEDYETMLALFESKRYSRASFVGHLMIEKLLKALFVQVNHDYPPFIHNLLLLAEKCKLDLNDEQKIFFITVTAFNINARYDDYKMSFQKKCTPEFTSIWIEKIKTNRLWIKEQIK